MMQPLIRRCLAKGRGRLVTLRVGCEPIAGVAEARRPGRRLPPRDVIVVWDEKLPPGFLRWRNGIYFAGLFRLLDDAHKHNHILAAEAVDEEFDIKEMTIAAPGLKWRGTATEKGESRVDPVFQHQLGVLQMGQECRDMTSPNSSCR
jgi:hypothetical protein